MDQNHEYNSFKKLLRAILIAYNNRIRIIYLPKIYREQEGTEIPFAKFGFSDLYALLESMPDTIRFVRIKWIICLLYKIILFEKKKKKCFRMIVRCLFIR